MTLLLVPNGVRLGWGIHVHDLVRPCQFCALNGSIYQWFSIQNGDLTGFWGLKKVVHGEIISFGRGTGDKNDN
jgi:hypothetical protein